MVFLNIHLKDIEYNRLEELKGADLAVLGVKHTT
jgi:hypothetical protein